MDHLVERSSGGSADAYLSSWNEASKGFDKVHPSYGKKKRKKRKKRKKKKVAGITRVNVIMPTYVNWGKQNYYKK